MSGDQKKIRSCFLFSVLVCSVSFGCAGKVGPAADKAPRHPVSGAVMLNGAPADHVVLSFVPQRGTPGMGGYAVSDKDGKFSVTDFNKSEGLQSGSYDVTFSKRVMLDGSPVPEGDGVTGDMTKELLPRPYTEVAPEQHPFVLTVNAPVNSLSYELKVKK